MRDISLDAKAVLTFLLINFAITWTIEAALIVVGRVSFAGFPPQYAQFVIAAVMWVPALAALISAKLLRQKTVPYGWHLGSIWAYLAVMIATPLIFAIIYGLTVALGLGTLDLNLTEFSRQVAEATGQSLPPFNPTQLLLTLLLVSTLAAPFVNSIFGLGEEIGWRGYLLPRLMPLGKAKAYVALGAIWGLWHAPLILVGFAYPGYPVLGVLMFMLFATTIGVAINELTLANRSVFLAGWIHGVINSQSYGIWRIVVVGAPPLLGGIAGILGIGILALVSMLVVYLSARRQPSPTV